MKYLIAAALATMAITASAQAQTPPAAAAPSVQAPPSRCTAASTPAPTLPDGAAADADDMATANTAFTAWAEGERAKLQCRRSEVEELRAALAARTAEYNSGVESLNGAIASWQAEVEEFNARPQNRRRGR